MTIDLLKLEHTTESDNNKTYNDEFRGSTGAKIKVK